MAGDEPADAPRMAVCAWRLRTYQVSKMGEVGDRVEVEVEVVVTFRVHWCGG